MKLKATWQMTTENQFSDSSAIEGRRLMAQRALEEPNSFELQLDVPEITSELVEKIYSSKLNYGTISSFEGKVYYIFDLPPQNSEKLITETIAGFFALGIACWANPHDILKLGK